MKFILAKRLCSPILFIALIIAGSLSGCKEKISNLSSQLHQETPPAQSPQETAEPTTEPSRMIVGKDGAQMVYVPDGVFFMGDDKGDSLERPRMRVFLEAFYIDRFEISNERFAKFIKEANYRPEGGFKFPPGREQYPAQWLTWKDVESYCKWAQKRLPTEYEWEKAARGVDGRIWPWGNDEKNPRKINGENVPEMLHEFDDSAGQSAYGCVHMADNVWEWVDDWLSAYVLNSVPDPRYGEKYKVLRGGLEIKGAKIRYSRATVRQYMVPDSAAEFTGGRCARNP